MTAMFRALFATFATLFSATEKSAKALEHLATVAEESAGAYADESRVNRTAKLAALNKDNNLAIESTK